MAAAVVSAALAEAPIKATMAALAAVGAAATAIRLQQLLARQTLAVAVAVGVV
jgi:hypothetical protein